MKPDTSTAAAEVSPRPLVLLAEDDIDTRKMLKHVLVFGGYDVVEIEDGLDLLCYLSAASAFEVVAPDLIVADIRMPHFSGLDMLRSVQRFSIAAPVVLVSAFCDETTKHLAEQGGAAALLAKPLAADELLATLAGVQREARA